MMPRLGLVQVERLHRILRARRQVVRVDVKHARALSIGTPRHVGSGSLARRTKRLDGPDLERCLRLDRKEQRQGRRHPLPQCIVSREQFARLLVIEARIRAQRVEEAPQVAGVADLLLDPLHFRPDPRDLRKTELVHLLRRHRGARVIAHEVRVPRRAVRQLRQADASTRIRQVLGLEIVVQPAIGRHHDGRDLLFIGLHQPLAIRHAEARREVQDRLPEDALLRIVDELRRELRDRALRRRCAAAPRPSRRRSSCSRSTGPPTRRTRPCATGSCRSPARCGTAGSPGPTRPPRRTRRDSRTGGWAAARSGSGSPRR